MNVSGASPPVAAPIKSEAAEPRGPDHDGDGDDRRAAAAPPAALPPGVGQILDQKA